MKRKDALWVMQMCRDRDARSEAEIEAFDTAIEALKNETIFSADRPRGEWIDENCTYYANCSMCGYQMDTHEERGYHNFCPNCGADMRGEDE